MAMKAKSLAMSLMSPKNGIPWNLRRSEAPTVNFQTSCPSRSDEHDEHREYDNRHLMEELFFPTRNTPCCQNELPRNQTGSSGGSQASSDDLVSNDSNYSVIEAQRFCQCTDKELIKNTAEITILDRRSTRESVWMLFISGNPFLFFQWGHS